MIKIKIIKIQNTYTYKIEDKQDGSLCITESGFKTQEEALKEAKKSYNKYINNQYPIHINNVGHTKYKKKGNDFFKIKNLKITDCGCKILNTVIAGSIILTTMYGTKKVINDVRELLPPVIEKEVEEILEEKEIITPSNCDFSNLHIIVRTAKEDTIGVGAVTSDMLTRLGIENEIITKDSDISSTISTIINQNQNIVLVNLETGYEKDEENTTIIGDSSNKRKYSSDVLIACINESLNEYSLNPVIKSGENTTGIWRKQSYIEENLAEKGLSDSISQLTIDIKEEALQDEIIRNDTASSIVEGIMRWTTLDITERYQNIYYTAQYGDTVVNISEKYGITINDIDENSDVNMNKGVRVGNTILVKGIPSVATNKIVVYNPYTTINSNEIEEEIVAYVVENGDTITKIANKYGVKKEDITVPSGNINNIYVGDTIYITTHNLYEIHPKTGTQETKQI